MGDKKNNQESNYPVAFKGVVRERAVVFDHDSTWDRLNDIDAKEREQMKHENAPQPVPKQSLKQNLSIMKPARKGPGNSKKRPKGMSDINP